MTLSRISPVTLLLVLALSCEESGNSPVPDTKPLPAATGLSQGLSATPANPLFVVEKIGPTVYPNSSNPIQMVAAGEFTIVGWAVDPEAQSAATGVDVMIDGVPYSATYGIPRQDVADRYKVPAYVRSGFSFSMPADLVKGARTVSIRVIAAGRKSFYPSPDFRVNVQ
jgi:hypothetical protein